MSQICDDAEHLAAEVERLKRDAWIPVSERLPEAKAMYTDGPESSSRVLAVIDGTVSEAWHEQTYKRRKWKWKTQWNSDAQVTHWMPLPDPPIDAARAGHGE